MPRVVVVTDSTACVGTPPAPESLRVIPVSLLFPDREARDGEVDPAEVYTRLARGEVVKSQAPAPAAYLDAIETGDHDGALVLTPADEFTVMTQHARLAVDLAAAPAAVVDTRTAAAGQGLVVRAALATVAAGADLAEVSSVAGDTATRVELVAAMYEPTALERSGHVRAELSSARGALIARFRDGEVVPQAAAGDPVRTLATAWTDGAGEPATTLVFHSALPRRAARLRRAIGAIEPVLTCGAAMGAHVGPGLVGVAWLRPGP